MPPNPVSSARVSSRPAQVRDRLRRRWSITARATATPARSSQTRPRSRSTLLPEHREPPHGERVRCQEPGIRPGDADRKNRPSAHRLGIRVDNTPNRGLIGGSGRIVDVDLTLLRKIDVHVSGQLEQVVAWGERLGVEETRVVHVGSEYHPGGRSRIPVPMVNEQEISHRIGLNLQIELCCMARYRLHHELLAKGGGRERHDPVSEMQKLRLRFSVSGVHQAVLLSDNFGICKPGASVHCESRADNHWNSAWNQKWSKVDNAGNGVNAPERQEISDCPIVSEGITWLLSQPIQIESGPVFNHHTPVRRARGCP